MKSVSKLFFILSVGSVVVGMLALAAYAGSKIVLVGQAEYSANGNIMDNPNDGNKHAGKSPIAFIELNTDSKHSQFGVYGGHQRRTGSGPGKYMCFGKWLYMVVVSGFPKL